MKVRIFLFVAALVIGAVCVGYFSIGNSPLTATSSDSHIGFWMMVVWGGKAIGVIVALAVVVYIIRLIFSYLPALPSIRWVVPNKWALAVIAAAIALLYVFSIHDWDMQAIAQTGLSEWQGIPISILVVALLLSALMIYYADPKDVRAAVIMTGIICLFIVVYELYKLDEIGVGQRRNLGYVVVIALGLMAANYLVKGFQKLVATILLVSTFVMLGFSHIYTWEQFSSRFLGYGQSRVVAYTGLCSGRAKVDTLGPNFVSITDDPSCILHLGIANGAVELNGPSGSITVNPGDTGSIPGTFKILRARAASGRPVISHTSCDEQQNRRYDGQNCI